MTEWRTAVGADGTRAHVEGNDGQGSDVQAEIVELEDAEGPYWAISIVAFGQRPARVYTNGALEESLEWSGEQWT